MSDTSILLAAKKEFYDIVMKYYETYTNDKSDVNRQVYRIILGVYKNSVNSNSIVEFKKCLNELTSEYNKIRVTYGDKVKEYQSLKNSGEIQKASAVKTEIDNIKKVSQAISDAYSNVKALVSKLSKNNVASKVTSKKEDTPVVKQTSDEEKKPEIKKQTVDLSDIDFHNPTVVEIQGLSNQIVNLKNELIKYDVMSSKATSIRKEIDNIANKRLMIAYNLFGYDGIKFIREVESMETRYASLPEVSADKEATLSEEEYLKELEENIRVIGDLKFFGIRSKYLKFNQNASKEEILNEYKNVYSKYKTRLDNLIKSLFETNNPVIDVENDYSINVNDLFTRLGTFNLRGGYQEFKARHKSGKIGNEAVSKELYNSNIALIEENIISFKKLASGRIKKNNGKVVIGSSGSLKESVKYDLDKKMAELYRMITLKQLEKSK